MILHTAKFSGCLGKFVWHCQGELQQTPGVGDEVVRDDCDHPPAGLDERAHLLRPGSSCWQTVRSHTEPPALDRGTHLGEDILTNKLPVILIVDHEDFVLISCLRNEVVFRFLKFVVHGNHFSHPLGQWLPVIGYKK